MLIRMIIYVDIKADSDGDGSRAKPFRSINEAAAMGEAF